jgi:hypothetical protein
MEEDFGGDQGLSKGCGAKGRRRRRRRSYTFKAFDFKHTSRERTVRKVCETTKPHPFRHTIFISSKSLHISFNIDFVLRWYGKVKLSLYLITTL